VALLDYDNDGLLDLYFVNGATLTDSMHKGANARQAPSKILEPALPQHTGNGKLQDVTERAGLRGSFYGVGAAAADFDNDGYTDLYCHGLRRQPALP
jgi:enediyne biosynthesis protein E4